jgi:hypothetical protein
MHCLSHAFYNGISLIFIVIVLRHRLPKVLLYAQVHIQGMASMNIQQAQMQ